MIFGKATTTSMSVLPMTILMMEVVPKNIEASMFALITAIITVSTDCFGDIVGGFVCNLYGITENNMSNYGSAVIFKLGMIVISMLLIKILPTKQEVRDLVERMDKKE